MSETKQEKRVSMGQVVITTNAQQKLNWEYVTLALSHHARGDWGDVDKHDFEVNEQAYDNGDRLMSVWYDCNKTKFWIITEADRRVTTVLLPEDY